MLISFPFIDLTGSKSLNKIPYSNITCFSSLNISNAYVFRKLKPRKYKYKNKEYITMIEDVQFLTNPSNIQVRM